VARTASEVKVECLCGALIDLSQVPMPGEHFFFPTADWDEVIRRLGAAFMASEKEEHRRLKARISDTLAGAGDAFFPCPGCQRLIVPVEDGYEFYRRDEGPAGR